MATLAPLASSRSAIARPMPEAPAVTTTRWPATAPPARPFDEPPRLAAAIIFLPLPIARSRNTIPAEERFLAPGRVCSDRDCDIGIDIKSYDLPQQRASARRDGLCFGHDRHGLRDSTTGLASPRQFHRRRAAGPAASRLVRLARTQARYGRLERLGRGGG